MHLKGGYPSQIAEFDPIDVSLCLNNAVWDIQRGNLLKLVEDKLIVTAYHGTKKLSSVEINDIYGSPPKFNALDYPTTARAMEKP